MYKLKINNYVYKRKKKIYISRHENTSTWIYQSYLIRSIIFPIFKKPFELSRPEFNINTQAPVNQHGYSSWWRSVDQRGGRSEGRRDTLNHVYHTFVISIRLSSRVLVFFFELIRLTTRRIRRRVDDLLIRRWWKNRPYKQTGPTHVCKKLHARKKWNTQRCCP